MNDGKLSGTMEQISIGATTTKDYKFIACNRYVVGRRNSANAGNVWVDGSYEGSSKTMGGGAWGYIQAIDGDVDSYWYTTIYFNVKAGAVIRSSGGGNGSVVQNCYGFN